MADPFRTTDAISRGQRCRIWSWTSCEPCGRAEGLGYQSPLSKKSDPHCIARDTSLRVIRDEPDPLELPIAPDDRCLLKRQLAATKGSERRSPARRAFIRNGRALFDRTAESHYGAHNSQTTLPQPLPGSVGRTQDLWLKPMRLR